MSWTLRPARHSDLPFLVQIEEVSGFPSSWTEQAFLTELELGSSVVSVVEHDGAGADDGPVGFVVFRLLETDADLLNIGVRPAQRKQGLGRQLLRSVVDACKETGVTNIFLEVRRTNTVAQTFYESCGFQVSGLRSNYYRGDGEDALIMQLAL